MPCGEGMAEWSICPEECENVSFWLSRDAAVTQCELYISAFFLFEIKMDAELVYMYQ
jgi:hypothetical protein